MRVLVLCAVLMFMSAVYAFSENQDSRAVCITFLGLVRQAQTVQIPPAEDWRLHAHTVRGPNQGQEMVTLSCVFSFQTAKGERFYLHLLNAGDVITAIRARVDDSGVISNWKALYGQ